MTNKSVVVSNRDALPTVSLNRNPLVTHKNTAYPGSFTLEDLKDFALMAEAVGYQPDHQVVFENPEYLIAPKSIYFGSEKSRQGTIIKSYTQQDINIHRVVIGLLSVLMIIGFIL